ncbi:MAG: Mrp/NBP35 family ATP-binding protein [Flavobacteriales bacterium]
MSDLSIEGNKVTFNVSVQNPAMHSRKRVKDACLFNIERAFGKEVECDVKVVPAEKKDSGQEQNGSNNGQEEEESSLKDVKNTIAIASGKGGVGKSTITANLAIGLAQKGYKVGLVDADIYGPSIPTMFDMADEKPSVVKANGKTLISPLENYGVKILSIGFFAEASQAVVWRGPMATKAIKQMFKDTHWDELDYLLIDLPPGTSDIHLTIVQTIPLTGGVITSTPQKVALADARKGVDMFQLEQINVPVIGFVENMAYFTPKELPENKYYIFGQEGTKKLSEELNIPLLGEIPLEQSIREAGDVGRPAILQEDTPTSKAFHKMCDKFIEQVNWRNENLSETERVKITRK